MGTHVLRRSPLAIGVGSVLVLSILGLGPAQAQDTQPPPMLLGEVTVEQLREAPYDAWFNSNYDAYTPRPEIMQAIPRNFEGLDIQIVFGTWCGDSQREVPRLWKTLDAMGWPEDQRRLVAVDRSDEQYKRSPDELEKSLEVYWVPTVAIFEGSEERGRIVEYPNLSLERDLQAILSPDAASSRRIEAPPSPGVTPSYRSYPHIRQWLDEGWLADPNVSADGLANRVRHLVASEGELAAAARVMTSRGQHAEGSKLAEVNCALFWSSSRCHHRLAIAQLKAEQGVKAAKSVQRALQRGPEPDDVPALLDLWSEAQEQIDGP